MQRIVPNLWFARDAEEAVDFYADAFPAFTVLKTERYPEENLPDFQQEFAGKILTIEFAIEDFRFIAINAGDEFRPNSSISFLVNFDPSHDPKARDHLNELYAKLVKDGHALMPLDAYPHSPLYGWVEDKYGVSWHLILTDPEGDPRPFIIPSFTFSGPAEGKAGEGVTYYTSVFDGNVGIFALYAQGDPQAGQLMFGDFTLFDQWFTAMDNSTQDITFTPGVSLMVECDDQAEIDYLWEALSAVPEAEACGWCIDQFGLSWQIVPRDIDNLVSRPGAYQRLLNMKKININELLG